MKKSLFWVTVLIGFFSAVALYHDFFPIKMKPDEVQAELKAPVDSVLLPPLEPNRLFGFVIDSMLVIEDKVKRNQNLSEILTSHNVPHEKIHEISIKSKDIFDLRKIGVNKKYTLICHPDSLKTARCLVYEPNSLEYVVFDLLDSIHIYKELRKIDTLEKTLSGEITRSLYEDMVAMGASPLLVDELADIFGWEIDFFRLQKGDNFKLIYEEMQVDGKYVGLGKIIGAYFHHMDEPHYAINYNQGNGEDFFDIEGNSLRKAFLRAPIEHSRITSRYSGRRFHPVLKRWKSHLGTDYAAPRGTPIRSVGDGYVTRARYGKYNGRNVKIRHNATYSTQYLHMSRIARGIHPGKRVKKGQIIGYVGSTGLATGNHVCYRFWKNGVQVDALKVYIPPSEPISEENLEDYFRLRDKVIERLDRIEIQSKEQKLLARIN